jgi:7-carboxy-7-deazaguanine synthase
MSIGEIEERVSEMGHHLACVTGGEPLLQEGAGTLVAGLLRRGYEVLVETSGALPINILPARARKIVDVKTPGSGEGGSFLRANLASISSRDELKFVVADRRDFDWSLKFIRRNHLSGRCEILMSPVYGMMDPATLAGWIIQSAMPLRLNIQIHKILWGADARGV